MGTKEKWNRLWAERGHATTGHTGFLDRVQHLLPERGRALDLAGGAGRNATWLAARGLDVRICDIAEQGLALARTLADERGVKLHTELRDVEALGPPPGPWDLVLVVHFLHRPIFDALELSPGGILVFVQPTERNLERHERPSRRFLLQEGELRGLLGSYRVLHFEEDWGAEGRHEARVVAQRAP